MTDFEAIAERAHRLTDIRRERRASVAEVYGERRTAELTADPSDVIEDIDHGDMVAALCLCHGGDKGAIERLINDAIDRTVDAEIERGAHLEVA